MFNEEKLNKRELKIWYKTKSNSGVPFLTGISGIGKSITLETIAKKLGMQYMPFNLTTKDEIELGSYPIEEKETRTIHKGIPYWVKDANSKPTLIHFEEIDKANKYQRSAVLGILNERRIEDVEFNDNVYMVASGNTHTDMDSEEMGSAIINRLIEIPFYITLEDWKQSFANENINPIICKFIEQYSEFFVTDLSSMENQMDEETFKFPSPRSLTQLSDYINVIENTELYEECVNDIDEIKGYVGKKCGLAFIQFIKDLKKISVDDIINDNVDYKTLNNGNPINLMQVQHVINEFIKYNILSDFNKTQRYNWYEFLSYIDDEPLSGYLSSYFKKVIDISDDKIDNENNKTMYLKEQNTYNNKINNIVKTILDNQYE